MKATAAPSTDTPSYSWAENEVKTFAAQLRQQHDLIKSRGLDARTPTKTKGLKPLLHQKNLRSRLPSPPAKGNADQRSEKTLNHKSVGLFVAMAAVIALGLTVGKPSRAQQNMTNPPDSDMPDAARGKQGVTHKSLLKSEIDGVSAQEVIVWDTEYAPRAINPRHYHPAAITFHVIAGTGIWQEDGKAPVTLKAGERLFVPAGTTHSHWNPSHTEKLRFLEFIVGEKDKAQSEPRAVSN